MKKVKLFGTRNEKDFLYLKLEKKQRLIETLALISKELGLYEGNFIFWDEEKEKYVNIESLTDQYFRAVEKNIEIEIFFGKNKVTIIFRTKNKQKILNLIDKYFKWVKARK